MSYSVLLIGWDVGPWKCSGNSKDALALVGWDGNRLALISSGLHGNLFSKLPGEIDLAALLAAAGWNHPHDETRVIVAIDAVFGWPRKFTELVLGKAAYRPNTGKKDRNIDNRFLYRETERFLNDKLLMKSRFPKTAVGDAIGSAATKAQYVLSRLRERDSLYVPPIDPWNRETASAATRSVIEVYPGATRFSPAFEGLKLPHGWRKLLGHPRPTRGPAISHLKNTDPEDALRCAMVAACYARMIGAIPLDLPSLYVPTDVREEAGYDAEALATEGWIFSPRRGPSSSPSNT